MKFVRQLLVAPAALGLIATGANAAELNINGVSDYAATASGNSLDQVTSVTQFSDVYPTDWAYQALANLVAVSYTHLRAPRDGLLSRMPSSA